MHPAAIEAFGQTLSLSLTAFFYVHYKTHWDNGFTSQLNKLEPTLANQKRKNLSFMHLTV